MKVTYSFFRASGISREFRKWSWMFRKQPESLNCSSILYSRTPALRDWDKSILVAAGVEFVGRDHVLQPDDQISIMPPVQGG